MTTTDFVQKNLRTVVKTPEEIKRDRMMDNLLNDDLSMLTPYLDEPNVTDIAIVDSGEIIVSRFRKGREFTNIEMPDYIAERIVKATAAIYGKSLDSSSGFPVLEGIIPKYMARITALMPPTVCRPELQIRKPPSVIYSLEDYLRNGEMTQDQYDMIVQYIKERKNIVVAGGTGSGKTTCTNAILKKMAEFTPDDNFYIVEDTPELQCNARMKTMIWCSKEFAYKAVEESLRFSPDRIIFGEVRSGDVMVEILEAWSSGHSGNVTTIHANDGIGTLRRIKGLLGKDNLFLVDDISEVVNLVVHMKKSKDGVRVDELFPVTKGTESFLAGLENNNLA